MKARGLTRIALPELRALLQGVYRGNLPTPLTRTALAARGFTEIAEDVLDVVRDLDQRSTTAVLTAAIAEREAAEARNARLELVWTGPELRVSLARDTAVIVQQMFADATRNVLVAGYSFDHATDILATLHGAMRDRGVTATFFLDIPGQAATEADVDRFAAAAIQSFVAKNWPFGPPLPAIYYDPRTASPAINASLHAKCIVVDDRLALVTSANFTNRGQTRNIEVGVRIEDHAFASQLAAQWWNLIETDLVHRWPG